MIYHCVEYCKVKILTNEHKYNYSYWLQFISPRPIALINCVGYCGEGQWNSNKGAV